MISICPKSGFHPDTMSVPSLRDMIQLPPIFLLVLDPSVEIYSGVCCYMYWTREATSGLVLKLEIKILIHGGNNWI